MAEYDNKDYKQTPFFYRITGKQSIERLDPIILSLVPNQSLSGCNAADRLDFVWETTCEKSLRAQHQSACILNKLHNSQIIESKSMLAYLQLLVDFPMLETFVAENASSVEMWAKRRWNKPTDNNYSNLRDWWVVKASKGNGGRDIWIMYEENCEKVVSELPSSDEYVIQRYVNNPMLFHEKKFHFRCYTLMMADGTAMVFQKAFILSAGLDFDYKDDDVRKHVTNLSVNKRFEGHPGQVPCDLQEKYPQLFESIKAMWGAVVGAAHPYMQHQVSALHFEFFGVDVIADTDGQCWLIEANRLPGLESSKNNQAQEDEMYDEMMTALLRIVLAPIRPALRQEGDNSKHFDLWHHVRSPAVSDCEPKKEPATCWANLLNWKAFTRKNRQMILAEFA